MKNALPLAKAEKMAVQIAEVLAPFCARIDVAGSIRRRCASVGDIDLVCLPKPGEFPALRERILTNKAVIMDGAQNIYVRLRNEVEVNVFIARYEKRELFEVTPGNYGTLLICRTGCKEFNIKLCERAKELGLAWNPYHGVFWSGKCIAAATEEEVFNALKLDFIPPEARTPNACLAQFSRGREAVIQQ